MIRHGADLQQPLNYLRLVNAGIVLGVPKFDHTLTDGTGIRTHGEASHNIGNQNAAAHTTFH